MSYPQRVVCLAAEAPEISDRLGAFACIVGVSGFARQPEVIIASGCGKQADLESIRARVGWEKLPAVQQGAVYEIASDTILQTGPGILEGAHQLATLMHAHLLGKTS